MTGLYTALLAFQKDAPAIQKTAINPHFRSKFVPLDTLVESVLPVLNKHGLVLSQSPTVLDGQPALRTVVTHAESGESLRDVMLLMAAKDDPQGQGSALTYARRYALMATLGLVADEDDDGNAATPRSAGVSGTDGEQPRGTPAPSPADKAKAAFDAANQTPEYDGTSESVVLPFGKHKGAKLGDLVQSDKGYVHWLAEKYEPKTPAQRLVKNAARMLLGQGADPLPELTDSDIPFDRTIS